MNKIYKVIWSKVKHQYVVVSELAHSNGKQSRTSRNSIRSRIAALVVCGAIAAFGVFSALPTSSAFAAGAGAITKPGQYIAVAVDSNNNSYQSGWNTKPYHEGDTRTFQDAQGNTHNYTWVRVDNKDYWVREGYTITIENGSRFTAYDQSGHAIAPNNKYIIDSQKSSDADDTGLISSSEVVLSENVNRQTNSGKLVDVSAGIYGGAVNTGGTEVKSTYNYYINDNNSGWKDVGVKTTVSGMSNNFKQVYQLSNGTYNTNRYGTGTTVSTDNLYVIDGTLGAFFNSNGSVYTGNVYGHNNEVLMTGVDSVNGNYYSYWGTKVNDPNMSMSNMTLGDHDKIVAGLQTNIDHVNGDIVQEIKLDGNTAGQGGTYQDGKGGTINLERRGYWNGTEFVDTGSVDGGITISSEGGAGGKDVAIKFANEDGSFTVDAGSKVEGITDTVIDSQGELKGLSINGQEYTIAAGGKSVTRSRVNDNGTITVYQGEDDQTGVTTENAIHDYALDSQEKTASSGSVTLTGRDRYNQQDTFDVKIKGLVTEDNLGEQIKTKNNLKVEAGDKGRWKITDASQDNKEFTNTTLADKVEKTGDKDSGYTYTVKDTANNTAVIDDVASATKLGEVNTQVNTNTENIASLDGRVTVNEGDITTIKGNMITGGQGNDDGTITLTGAEGKDIATVTGIHDYAVKEGNILAQDGSATITVEDRYNPANTKEVKIDGLVTYNTKTITEDGITTTVTDYDNIKLSGKNGTLITNLKDGYVGEYSTDAVNGSQLYATNQKVDAGWTATDGTTNIAVNPTETGTTTLKFAGDNNITVTADAENNAINVELNPDVNLKGEGDNSDNRVWLSGSNGTITVTTENNLPEKTTVINGGNVYVGSSVSVGDKVEITDKDITGLSNTSWNGTTDDESRAATEGQLKDVSDTVNAGWTATDSNGASIVVNPENGSTLNFAGDRNIEVKANEKDGSIDVSLKDDIVLGGKEDTSRVEIGGTNGTIMATKDPNSMAATTTIDGGNVYVGSSISVGDKVEITDKDITGLSNTSWNGTTDDESRAATEGQLKTVSDTVNAGWTATDSNGNSIDVKPENGSTLNFAGDRNIEVKANEQDGSIDVSLDDDIVLGGKEGTSRVEIGGTNGTIMATKDPNSMAATTTIDGGNIYAGNSISVGANDDVVITDKDITGLSNTTWDGKTDDESRAATEGQLKVVSDDVNAGWIATDSQNNEVKITPDNNKLNFAGDENVTVTAANNEIKVALNDDIALGEYLNNGAGVLIGGSSGTISATNSITVGEDQGLIIDGQKKEIQGLSNTTWNEKIANDAAVEGSTAASTAATQGQLQEVSKVANAGWTASDGTNSISVKPNETLKFVGDENLTVSADGTDKELKVSLNDDITLGDGENAIKIDGTNGTLNIGSTFAVAEDGTVLSDGDVIADADGEKYSLSEVGKYAVRYDKTNDGISTITLADGDDLSGTRIKNVADGVDPKDAVNVSQLEAVEATANAGWNAKAGDNTINVKPDQTLNFEGDGNITVSATSGTSSELKFGLNHNITLDNVENANTMLVLNTDGKNADGISGYIPKNYKDDEGHINDFIEEHGGFAIYYANPSLTTDDMTGTFGVTTDGVVHAKDVISYYSASSGSQSDVIRYSLNDVGDIVTQISHAVFDEGEGKTGMEYTLISDFEDEADKDSPFEANEGKTRTIGLAVRQDGAVIVGAVVNDEGISGDYGIRINAETDADGNNKATITGLENTEWKPPTPVATLAANDGSATVTSRAATESQLNDLYSAVAAYDVNVDGTIDYSHIALAGTPYGASRAGNGTPTGGTSITNVAYASGNDGSEAVNVDYLNNAIKDAVKDGPVASNEKHLDTSTSYTPNEKGEIAIDELDGTGNKTGNQLVINNVASKDDIKDLNDKVGNVDFSGTNHIDKDTDNLTDAIKDLDSAISDMQGDVTQQVEDNTVSGGHVDKDGNVVLETNKDKNIQTDIKLTDSEVVGGKAENGKLTINKKDNYTGAETSIDIEGVATTDMIGAKDKEDLATAYKDADEDGNATTEYITESGSMVEADVALDHAIQDVANTSYANDMVLSNRIDSVEKRLGNVEERIDKVGAMAAAIANLRTMGFDPEAPTEIAIGVGQYKSETGIAIGVFHYPNQDFMLSASLSSSGDELMGGIGATWKLGRKSAAERAKDEEARHLEQAEEMKKLAQQEKVKAQAQRHAKLLAERQQASQKNA